MKRGNYETIWMLCAPASAVTCTLFLLTFVTVLPPRAMAQAVAGAEVNGYVTDPSGSAVPGAQVTITETGKHQVHSTRADQGGRYSFPNLDVGRYDLTVSAPGFNTYSQPSIVLQVASNISVDVQLQLGAVTQTVEVKASPTMLETKDNSIAEVVDSARVVDLPLNGRNATQLILLTGASSTAVPGDFITSKNIGGSNGSAVFAVAGGQTNG
jgi:hypothetical protein